MARSKQYEERDMLEPWVVEQVLDAPVALVWRAITDPGMMKHWYFDVPAFRAEIGCRFEFLAGKPEHRQYLHVCQVTDVVPGRRLSYSWRFDGEEGDSEVVFELFPEGARTRLRLTHSGLESFAANPDLAIDNFREGWRYIIGTSLHDWLDRHQQTA